MSQYTNVTVRIPDGNGQHPLLVTYVAEALRRLSEESPRTDGELVAMATSHPSADVQDLASALFHERTGQHANGTCDLCELPHVEVLAEQTLARREALAVAA